MFRNIGRKIKALARDLFILQMIGFTGVGIAIMAGAILKDVVNFSPIFYGIAVIVIGLVVSWLSTCLLYAFGELVESSTISAENSETIVEQNKKILKALKSLGGDKD